MDTSKEIIRDIFYSFSSTMAKTITWRLKMSIAFFGSDTLTVDDAHFRFHSVNFDEKEASRSGYCRHSRVRSSSKHRCKACYEE